MTRKMALEYTLTQMEDLIKVNGQMENSMAKELS